MQCIFYPIKYFWEHKLNIKTKKHVSTKFNKAESINLLTKSKFMNKNRFNNAKKIKRRILSETETSENSTNYLQSDTSEGTSDNDSEDENLQADHVNKENYNIEDYVIFVYEGSYFVRKVESISEEGVLLKSMQKSLKNWKQPEKEDLNLYPMSDIIEKNKTPQKVNKNREIYYVPEIQKYWDFY